MSFFFSSTFTSEGGPSAQRSIGMVHLEFYATCQVCNQSFAIVDLMMVVADEPLVDLYGNVLWTTYLLPFPFSLLSNILTFACPVFLAFERREEK